MLVVGYDEEQHAFKIIDHVLQTEADVIPYDLLEKCHIGLDVESTPVREADQANEGLRKNYWRNFLRFATKKAAFKCPLHIL